MTIHSYFKADKGDPDWQYTPDYYFDKKFKIIDASTIELQEGLTERIVLRQTPSDKTLLAKHLRVSVLSGACLDLVIINDADTKLQQIFLYDIQVKENATLNLHVFVKDGKLNKHIFQVILDSGAHVAVSGLVSNTVGGDSEVITKILHQGISSDSNQLVLGISENNSQTVFQSMTLLAENSESSRASIENCNLILSKGSRCYGKPEVHVDADSVAASYGSFTEYLDEKKLQYIRSRGISNKDARNIIIDGFRNQVLSLMEPSLAEELTELYR